MTKLIADTVFCDDIRREDNGKAILIGVYGTDLVPGQMPSTFPISIWIKVRGLSSGSHKFRLRYVSPDVKSELEIEGETLVDDKRQPAIFVFGRLPTQVTEYGDIVAYMSFDDDGEIEVGRLPVRSPPSDATA